MSTPAAKRRRVDAANAVLRKPFHSPVIRRLDDDAVSGEGATSKTPDAKTPAHVDAYSPSSPSVPTRAPQPHPQTVRAARSHGALQQCQTPHNRSLLSAPLKFKTPLYRGAVKRKISSLETPASVDSHGGGDDKKPSSSSHLLALVVAHDRHAAQQDAVIIRDLDAKLETVRQARRIEGASYAAGAGAATLVDQELRDLVSRWKGAARGAAEELFEMVRERVDNAGGPKAWKEMRQRQMDFYQGFDAESPSRRKPAGGDVEEELEGDDDDEGAEHRLTGGGQAEDGGVEEENEPEFNMAQMLQSLNIDLSLLGYDEDEEKWID